MSDKKKSFDYLIYLPFIFGGIILAVFLCFTPLRHDDLNSYNEFAKNASLKEIWEFVKNRYFIWSSRTIVEFVLMIFEKLPKPVWAVNMGFCWFLLQKATTELVTDKKSIEFNIFVSLLFMLFPFRIMETAGWIATFFTYLTPVTCAAIVLLALRPIYRESYSNEVKTHRDKRYVYVALNGIGYTLLAVYAFNLEQIAVAFAGIFALVLLYEIICKKVYPFHVWIFVLALASVIFALLNPGNKFRTGVEIHNWFPKFEMLGLLDKFEMGLTTTALWLMRLQNFFWIIFVIMLASAMFQKYEGKIYRCIGVVPLMISMFFMLARTSAGKRFKFLRMITKGIKRSKLDDPTIVVSMGLVIQWALVIILYVSVAACLVLLFDKENERLIIGALFLAALGSRWMMGFSPTIYASGYRTGTLLIFLIMIIGSFIYDRFGIKNKKLLFSVMGVMAVINLGLWGQMLYTQWR